MKQHRSVESESLWAEFRRELETLQSKSWVTGIVRLYGSEFRQGTDQDGMPTATSYIVLELMEVNLRVLAQPQPDRSLLMAGGRKTLARPGTSPPFAM